MLTGQCYCGAIQYQVSGAISSKTICHCDMCRGTTGAPCVAWFTAPLAQYRLLSGSPVQFRSSSHATRSFCGVCGTQLTFIDDATPGEVDVTTCSLHEAAHIGPEYHTWVDSALPWMVLAGGLPRYRHGSGKGAQLVPTETN